MIVVIAAMANFTTGCLSTRKFTRNEVKTSADTLSARIDSTETQLKGDIKEVRDGVSRVDQKVDATNKQVATLDNTSTQHTQQIGTLRTDVTNVDQKAGQAQTSAQKANTDVTTLGQRFQNRNQYNVAAEKAVLFKFNSAKLEKDSTSALDEVAAMLQQNPDAVLVLEGRTDSLGDPDYNVQLGERRAESVKRYLTVDKGVPVYRLHEVSFGEDKPIADNKSKEGREKNRAVNLTVLTPKS